MNDRNYSQYATCGFGSNLNPDIAMERSISEACQAMVEGDETEQLTYRSPTGRYLAFAYSSLYNLYHFNRLEIVNRDNELDYDRFSNQATDSVLGDIRKILFCIQKCIPETDVVVVNLTKEILNIPVVRVVVSGLQRCAEPMLSVTKRLFELPKKLGYHEKELDYKGLYNGPYPH